MATYVLSTLPTALRVESDEEEEFEEEEEVIHTRNIQKVGEADRMPPQPSPPRVRTEIDSDSSPSSATPLPSIPSPSPMRTPSPFHMQGDVAHLAPSPSGRKPNEESSC